MQTSIPRNRKIVEVLSITGIMAFFFYANIEFGFLEWAGGELMRLAPESRSWLITLVGSLWIGMLVYSYHRYNQTKLALNALQFLETSISKKELSNPVSGLPNRIGFEHVMNETSLMSEFPNWSILAIEVSNIESVRNVYGRSVGDSIENRIGQCLGEIGNEHEFIAHDDQSIFWVVVACESKDEVDFRVEQIVETIALKMGRGFTVQDETIKIEPKFARIDDDFCKAVDMAAERGAVARRITYLFEHFAMKADANIAVFDNSMEISMHRQIKIENGLHQAIQKGEIVPYFQPFVDMKNHNLLGFEILARWLHPEEEMIPPYEFISVAERRGILGEMTASLLEQACIAARNWRDDLFLAINISPTDLHDDTLATKVLDILERTGIDPGRLEIEITEDALIEKMKNVEGVVSRLKEHGISLAIDDFGIGYSSLNHLRSLPFDKIKIDRSFVQDIETDMESKSIVKSVIALSKSLGMRTTAEGIESNKSYSILQKFGCVIGQGYLLAKPLPEDEISAFLKDFDDRQENFSKAA